MQTAWSFRSSVMPRDDLRRTLSDYLALDRARAIRRLLVSCCGGIAAILGLVMTLAHFVSPVARIMTVAVCLAPPVCAWLAEIAIEQRLIRRLEQYGGVCAVSVPAPR